MAHAQFATIHPFVDGNGRTGRVIAHAMLRHRRITASVAAPISAGILCDIDGCFRALSEFRNGIAFPIMKVFVDAAIHASATGEILLSDLAWQMEASRELLADLRADASAYKVLPLLIGQPITSAKYLKSILGINDSAAQRAIATLNGRGILQEETGLSRNRVWQHNGVLQVPDEYAASNRRDTIR